METLRWSCDVCAGDIDDGTGYAAVDLDGEDATWRVVHEHCDPSPAARRSHRVLIAELRSAASTLRVTAYLLTELDWMRATDWSRLLLNAVAQLLH